MALGMTRELIVKVEVSEGGELLLYLDGEGMPMHQHVYREAAGDYLDKEMRAFKSTSTKSWSSSQWFAHIVAVVRSGLGVELSLNSNVVWQNISEDEIAAIEKVHAT
jgi:hypothetical protein